MQCIFLERDSKEHVDIYAKFGLKVGHNCRDSKYEKQKVYTQCDVVYGDVAAFQRDFLMNSFYGEDNGIGGRKIGCVIVDEVDSMLLDKVHTFSYIYFLTILKSTYFIFRDTTSCTCHTQFREWMPWNPSLFSFGI